jgi:hypothetical protein
MEGKGNAVEFFQNQPHKFSPGCLPGCIPLSPAFHCLDFIDDAYQTLLVRLHILPMSRPLQCPRELQHIVDGLLVGHPY